MRKITNQMNIQTQQKTKKTKAFIAGRCPLEKVCHFISLMYQTLERV